MKRLTALSSLLLVALLAATGCKSNDAKSMGHVPPPAADGPPIASTNTNLYGSPAPPVTAVDPLPPVVLADPTPTPELTNAQANAGNVTLASPLNTSGRTYTVQQGDTLWRIASNKYGNGQKWRDIVAANPGLSPSQMRIGQTINLP